MPEKSKLERQTPDKLTLRAYNVGFGDCFLLSFHYGKDRRHVLIDFGSTSAPKNAKPSYMLDVAKDIREQCRAGADGKAKLHAIVATHRHRDHISGFTTGKNAPGTVIASLEPDVVIQPWTEDPNAKPDAKTATVTAYIGGKPDPKAMARQFIASLDHMHAVSAGSLEAAGSPNLRLGKQLREQLAFLGDDNIQNVSAIRNLMEMGRKSQAYYVHCGSKSGLEKILPGVDVQVLGPPTIEQSAEIRKERTRDADEFWQFRAFWQFQKMAAEFSGAAKSPVLFPHAPRYGRQGAPPNVRWFVSRAQKVRGDQLLELVRSLDAAMNNTSVILLFQIGKMKLLFPGDAQIENWSFALGQKKYLDLLADVNVYKVGHHGSLNATPKTLWKLFRHKHDENDHAPDRLQTVLSTKPGKHGSAQAHTEVPRRTLVDALSQESEFFSTTMLRKSEISKELEFEFR